MFYVHAKPPILAKTMHSQSAQNTKGIEPYANQQLTANLKEGSYTHVVALSRNPQISKSLSSFSLLFPLLYSKTTTIQKQYDNTLFIIILLL